MPLKSDGIDAKAVTFKGAGMMLDATHWRNAGIHTVWIDASRNRKSGRWANAVYVYPLSTCLDVCAMLCHVRLWYNNGLQAV